MATAKLIQLDGGEGTLEIPDALIQGRVHQDLLFRAVQSYLTNQRQGTHATKTRAQVAGSGRKVWPQKHTGRARHGDRRSPIWVGGGTTFGPQPREYEYKLPKKMRRQALVSAIRDRFQSDRVKILDRIEFPEGPKTKAAIALLERLELPWEERSVLVVVSGEEFGIPVKKSFSNLPKVECMPAMSVHTYDILKHEWLVLTAGALRELAARVGLGEGEGAVNGDGS